MERLKRRTDFKAAAKGARVPAGAFILQARRRADDDRDQSRQNAPVRVGFTVSRQVGNAVERNRVRRRLREMVRLAPAAALRAGYDYVLIGRRAALGADFADMTRQFDAAIRRIHTAPRNGQRGEQGSAPDSAPATGSGQVAPPHRASSARTGRNRRRDDGRRDDGRRDNWRRKSGPRSDEHESR